MDLSAFPRVALGSWPTPLEDAPRLATALGSPPVLIKRDDVNGLGAGGNKLRKLEFLLGQAIEQGADTIITFGALQTNHGRQTAAACAKLGLRCELVLTAKVPMTGEAYERSGNVVLDHMFGANVHVCADAEETAEAYEKVNHDKAVTLPVGGSNGLGTLGYVAAAVELVGQLTERGIGNATIVVPQGSGATAAGIALGTELLGWPGAVHAASVSHTAGEARQELAQLAGDAAELLGTGKPELGHVTVTDDTVGPGYGVPTEDMWKVLKLFAETEGVILDPVYTGKAAVKFRELAPASDVPVVFLHTGGLPGFYGYAPEAVAQF
ncbi:D-cysteine desulfhydrase family protein [Lentzea flava]|uniref:1-aminocyclopropane-1-carboxylate deaminase n=1 Tax=Lentzea flava TaxID=103732 RepID=A0ABQ2VE63_9PSEU|nr:D-cysteine desulfhydrase family protein [Lentzea flava]MCP2204631.1 D-cysteine desulfhydrase [Lentzea flava]GGU79760.1 1-aminocyclopropane-1-carboxylate deaminase [Lentzea flava]